MNKISRRQLFFFLACVLPVGKLLVLPAQLAKDAGNDVLLPLLVHYLVQAGAIFCVLLLARKNLSLFDLLERVFPKPVAAAIDVLFALFLLAASLTPVLEQKLFIQAVFYDTLPSIFAFLPFFVFGAYIASKPFCHLGRMWDILAFVFLVGIAGILLLAAPNADYGALLPVGGSGLGILRGTMSACGWFFDAALLIPFLGNFTYEKGTAWKGCLSYLAGGLTVLFFYATFYGVFEETAVNQAFAFAKISKYFSGITVLGRIDYFFIFALSLVLLFYTVLPVHGAISCALCVGKCPRHLSTVLSCSAFAALLVLTVLFDFSFGDVLQAITKQLFWLFPLFSVLFPLFLLLLNVLPGRKRRA